MEREKYVYMAKLAEQAKRYDDMAVYMSQMVAMGVQLTSEERNLWRAAFRKAVGQRREAWRGLVSAATDSADRLRQDYIRTLEDELKDMCSRILCVLDQHLVPASATAESRVFRYKTRGDLHRYVAEVVTDEQERLRAVENAYLAYKAASDIAKKELLSSNAVRLGLALNFSLYYYDILEAVEPACCIAQSALDAALAGGVNILKGESHKEVRIVLEFLKFNLDYWTKECESLNRASQQF